MEPQGAMVGDNPTAVEIFDRLQRGETAFKITPTGNAPVGGSPHPTSEELAQKTPRQVIPVEGFKGNVSGLRVEMRELRADIQALMEILRGL